jgi:beta-lactam-binding protein with PASTA domain
MFLYKRKKNARGRWWEQWQTLLQPQSTYARYGVRIGLILIVCFVCFVITSDVVMPVVTRHGNEFSLPDIVGMTVLEAEPVLQEADLILEITSEEYHPDKPGGTILTQFPVGGTMVKSGRTVKVVTSLGQKAMAVPDVRGFSVRQARLSLEAAGFTLGGIEWTSTDSLPEKVVVFSYPTAGAMIPYGSAVNLMVSRGPYQQTVIMPSLIGLSLADATAKLGEVNLKVGQVTRVVDENYLPDTIMEQSEDAGTELLAGEAIDLVVSATD